jgi:hypothetical protein
MEIDQGTRLSEAFIAYDGMMKTLYNYFGANYKAERVAAIWNFLKPCRIKPAEYVRLAEIAQQKLESMNGNLGSRLKDIYHQDIRTAGQGAVAYDLTEDFKYPIGNLHQGLLILRDKGEEAFDKFAKMTNMPLNDRSRVRHTLLVRYPDFKAPLQAERSAKVIPIAQTEIFKTAERRNLPA